MISAMSRAKEDLVLISHGYKNSNESVDETLQSYVSMVGYGNELSSL